MSVPYTGVLIDDNKITVLSLQKSIDWEALGIQIVGTAYDGREGKQLIIDKNPDIIITDITMPYMDGLTMIEAADIDYDKKILIVITGYDKFQYATRAIKLSAFDYILKPIDDDELTNTLKRAVEKLNQISLQEKRSEGSQATQMTIDLINHNDHKISEYFGEDNSPRYYVMIAASPKSEFSRPFLERLDNIQDIATGRMFLIIYERSLLILMSSDQITETWEKEILKTKSLILNSGETANVGIGRIGTGSDSLYALYLSAYDSLLHNNTRNLNSGTQVYDIQLIAKNAADHVEGISSFDGVITMFQNASNGSILSIKIMIVIFCSRIMELHSNWRADLNEYSIEGANVSSFEMFARWLKSILGKIDELKEKQTGKSDLVIKALQYIRSHCAENVRLEQAAAYLYVSPNYLSALISKETGRTFQQHVIDERMNYAKSLLDNSRMNIEEISAAVGYQGYISFYNAFKKHEGMTPKSYRERNL